MIVVAAGEQITRCFFLSLAKVKLSIISDKQETKLKRYGEQSLQNQKNLVLTHKIGKQEVAIRKKTLEAEMSETAEMCVILTKRLNFSMVQLAFIEVTLWSNLASRTTSSQEMWWWG